MNILHCTLANRRGSREPGGDDGGHGGGDEEDEEDDHDAVLIGLLMMVGMMRVITTLGCSITRMLMPSSW